MNFIEDNNKKFALALTLSLLMIIIMVIGTQFQERLKVATLTQNNMIEFNEYSIFNGNIKYDLPKEWIVSVSENESSYGIYTSEFVSEDANIKGDIIVTKNNLTKSLEEAVNELETLGIKDYSIEDISVSNVLSKRIQYDLKSHDKNISKIYVYCIPYNDYIIKATFSIKEKKVKENTKLVFDNIVKTLYFN